LLCAAKSVRRVRMNGAPSLFALLLLGCAASQLRAAPAMPAAPLNPADVSAFHAYLSEHKLSAHWSGDPTPIASAELESAYPGMRFYYTFQPAPPPVGAPIPSVLEAHKRAMEVYSAHSLRLTIGIDSQGEVRPYQVAADFNAGLQPVKCDDEARVAAAAILTLLGTEEISPGVIPASAVIVMKSGSGWSCRVSQQPKGIEGTVLFDLSGRCIKVDKALNYSPPVPS
jgi:hypothetical protein